MKTSTFFKTTALAAIFPIVAATSASAQDSVTIQAYDYFSTESGFGDGDISVFDGKARWSGSAGYQTTPTTDGDIGVGTNTGTFGDGTVLDYQFVGTNRSTNTMITKAAGTSPIISNDFTVETFGASGGVNNGLDAWYASDPDDIGTFDTESDSSASWVDDYVTGGDQLRGVIDVSGLSFAQIYFVYGSYKNAASVQLGTGAGLSDLGTLELPFDGPDNDRLVIQEVTILNDNATYGDIHFNYSASGNNGRGRFSAVIVDGTVVPEPSAFALIAGMFGLTWVMIRRR